MTEISYEDEATKEVITSVKDYVTNLVIPDSVIKIFGEKDDKYAFYLCKDKISSVTFGVNSKLREIGPFSFYNTTVLKSIDLSPCSHLETIGTDAFHLSSIESVVFPTSSLRSIWNNGFESTKISSVFIPATVEVIGSSCFLDCQSLTKAEFGKGINLISLPDRLFQKTKLVTITIPKSVMYYKSNCLENIKTLESVLVEEGSEYFESIDGILYDYGMKTLMCFPMTKTGKYTLPSTLKSIGSVSAMYSKLTEVVFPYGLTSIYSWAYAYSGLTSLILPDTVTRIDNYAFSECLKLQSIKFSAGLTSLSSHCFSNCGLSSVVIPEGITKIGDSCFQYNYNLISIILPSSLQSLGGAVFHGCNSKLVISFNESSNLYIDEQYLIMNKAKTSINQYIGSTNRANISIPDTIQEILSNAFLSKTVESIIIGKDSQLTKICEGAFKKCNLLKNIVLPATVTTIHNYAFQSCMSLKELTIPASLTSIGESVFVGSGIEKIVFEGNGITYLPIETFYNCRNLSSITLPSSLNTICEDCFAGCISLTQINIPRSITIIKSSAFKDSGVETITLEEGCAITKIDDNAFLEARQLTRINLPDTIESIGYRAFESTNLETFTVPFQCETIGDFCFKNCKSLTSINITNGSMLNRIGLSFLQGCSSLASINGGNEYFIVENCALFNKERTDLIAFPPMSSIHFFTFPQHLRTIGQGAFYECLNLRCMLIPDDSVQTIDNDAFSGCKNLKSINIPLSVTRVGDGAFKGCKSLKCGVIVESFNSDFRNSLITRANLPKNALFNCMKENEYKCASKQLLRSYTTLLVALIWN